MYDLFFIGDKSDQWKTLKNIYPNLKQVDNVAKAKQQCFTKFFWVIWPDLLIDADFDFDYTPDDWSQDVVHVFLNGLHYDGICLIPKKSNVTDREIEHRFFVKKKEVDIIASYPRPYDIFNIETTDDYKQALQNTTTEMFWMSSPNIEVNEQLVNTFYISHHNQTDRKQNHAFKHVNDMYNGLFLCSIHQELSQREILHRFPVARKEHDIVGSGPKQYDIFYVDTYDEYLDALQNSKTEMFWMVPPTVDVNEDFKFDVYFTHDNTYDLRMNHVYLNGEYHDGVVLCSKKLKISQREWHFKFIAGKKEHDILVSNPKPYDIVFISYTEPNADENFKNLMDRFPDRVIHRVHGVTGIHQAHIEAAKICNTPMVWIVDGDAEIEKDFNFDYQVPAWQYNHVHVWRSKNPVNGLVYGYGGVKLFPRELTENMDTNKPDMTTSISDKFVAVKYVSNITKFNTGEFETWKSAFRECCKLSSKIIDRQKNDETNMRLKIWTSIGKDKPYGEYAISGARAGMAYGTANKNDTNALKLINDFDWLRKQFDGNI